MRAQHLVTYCLVANTAFRSHACQNRYSHVGIIKYDHLAFGVVETVQSAGILGKCAFPRNRHGKKKGIEAGIIKPLAVIYDACRKAIEGGGQLADILATMPEIVDALGGVKAISHHCDPANYLGLSGAMVDRVLGFSAPAKPAAAQTAV